MKAKSLYFQKKMTANSEEADVYFNDRWIDTIPASFATPKKYARYGVRPFKGLTYSGLFPLYQGEFSDTCHIYLTLFESHRSRSNGCIKTISFTTKKTPAPAKVELIVNTNPRYGPNKMKVNCLMAALEYTVVEGRIALVDADDPDSLVIMIPYEYYANNFNKENDQNVVNFIKKLLLLK